MSRGVELIAEERERQIEKERWTAKHDDDHAHGQLTMAAVCYASPKPIFVKKEFPNGEVSFLDPWPWTRARDKRGKDSWKRRLVKAGALIAAEIDRLERLED